MKLTKQDLIDAVYEQVDIPKYQSTRLVESLLDITKKLSNPAKMS